MDKRALSLDPANAEGMLVVSDRASELLALDEVTQDWPVAKGWLYNELL